jgi:ferredoxin
LLPERITLDEWGFPIVTPDVPDSLRSLANEAVAACPHSALRIVHR